MSLLKKDKNITPKNKNRQKHGAWSIYGSNGELYYLGSWYNDKKIGYWEHYHWWGILDEEQKTIRIKVYYIQ